MKQIITVLAILISGIASAQSNWEQISSCTEGEIIWNGEDYVVLEGLLDRENARGNTPGRIWFFCLREDITNNDNYNRYFRWYCNAEERTYTGNDFTRDTRGNGDLMANYIFINHPVERYRSISIRIYPDTYSDGQRYNDRRDVPTQGISNVIERAKQSKFEVRTGASGRSRLTDPDRLKDSAQDAWEYAITH